MQIFALYAGLLGLTLVYLSFNVVSHRKKNKVGIGDGGNDELARAVRVQGNFTEYVPIALLLLAVFEYNGGSQLIAHISGTTLLIARLMHAHGLGKTDGKTNARVFGVLLTWVVIIGLSVTNIYSFIIGDINLV